MNTTESLNTPVRNCQNCAHCKKSPAGVRYDFCKRFQGDCEFSVHESWAGMVRCGPQLREWRPAPPSPPRRSLRRWLIDLLFA